MVWGYTWGLGGEGGTPHQRPKSTLSEGSTLGEGPTSSEAGSQNPFGIYFQRDLLLT